MGDTAADHPLDDDAKRLGPVSGRECVLWLSAGYPRISREAKRSWPPMGKGDASGFKTMFFSLCRSAIPFNRTSLSPLLLLLDLERLNPLPNILPRRWKRARGQSSAESSV